MLQAFCWLCGAATGTSHTWTEISGHSCGRYKDEADRRIDEAQRNVKRYMHYYTRWCAACSMNSDVYSSFMHSLYVACT